ncbi:MAG TPA: flavodoxin family protein [Acidobacteriota bacterium]|nr:flavodoxin family protein [Acidobacteriota bacterium]
MNVMAINGSPRKTWNTAMMLEKALEGARSKGAGTELIHLYDLVYRGCISCFACKAKGGEHYGACAMKDDLTSILKKAAEADAVILGSPIYFGNMTGEMRSFLERFLFQYLVYANPPRSLFPKKMKIGLIYTMNAPEAVMKDIGYDKFFATNEMIAKLLFGSSETICSYETLQFEDYSKVVFEMFDPSVRVTRRRDVFPQDLQKAFDMGVRFASA